MNILRVGAAVLAAADSGDGVALPAGAVYPSSALAFTGIRPGGWIIAPAGCTTNFVFGSLGDYSIGTAGHCTDVGDEITMVAAPHAGSRWRPRRACPIRWRPPRADAAAVRRQSPPLVNRGREVVWPSAVP